MNPRVSRALESSWRLIARLSRYLGPLLWDTVKYFWCLLLDTVGGLRILVIHWRARRDPARATEYVERQTALRARRAERWTPWRTLPATRKLAVRLAAVAVVALAVLGTRRLSWESVDTPAARAAPAPAAALSSDTPRDAAAPTGFDLFRSEIKTASPRQWSTLQPAALAARDRGEWDDFRVGSPVVMKDAGAPNYSMWYVGCRFAGREYGCGVGHATSADGVVWTRRDSPVFVPPDLPTTHWLSTIAMVKRANRYLMWYSIDGDPFADRPRGTLHMATSADGLVWENVGQVLTTANEATRAIKHMVYDDGQLFHLWFFDASDAGDESLVHFTSRDGKAWTGVGGDTFDGRAGSVGRPWVTSDGRGGFRALLVDFREGAALRWLTSPDGTAWTAGDVERGMRVVSDGTSIIDAFGLQESDGLWLWTTTAVPDRRAAQSIGVAYKKGPG